MLLPEFRSGGPRGGPRRSRREAPREARGARGAEAPARQGSGVGVVPGARGAASHAAAVPKMARGDRRQVRARLRQARSRAQAHPAPARRVHRPGVVPPHVRDRGEGGEGVQSPRRAGISHGGREGFGGRYPTRSPLRGGRSRVHGTHVGTPRARPGGARQDPSPGSHVLDRAEGGGTGGLRTNTRGLSGTRRRRVYGSGTRRVRKNAASRSRAARVDGREARDGREETGARAKGRARGRPARDGRDGSGERGDVGGDCANQGADGRFRVSQEHGSRRARGPGPIDEHGRGAVQAPGVRAQGGARGGTRARGVERGGGEKGARVAA
mmetsp:Transcript_14269/g.58086  ORF Transcript_14269/g.58086 Transcript_14269/m.58086 type:complete len:326 (+) Transcript_14269:2423-3400(+)